MICGSGLSYGPTTGSGFPPGPWKQSVLGAQREGGGSHLTCSEERRERARSTAASLPPRLTPLCPWLGSAHPRSRYPHRDCERQGKSLFRNAVLEGASGVPPERAPFSGFSRGKAGAARLPAPGTLPQDCAWPGSRGWGPTGPRGREAIGPQWCRRQVLCGWGLGELSVEQVSFPQLDWPLAEGGTPLWWGPWGPIQVAGLSRHRRPGPVYGAFYVQASS